MTNTIIPNDTAPANWPRHTLEAWRQNRQLLEDIADLRDGLHAAVDVIADSDRQIARLKQTNLNLKAQLHAALSGRTIAEERQQPEREQLQAEFDRECDAAKGRAA